VAQRATLADVAERAGVSKTAASLILNDRPGSRISADAVERIRRAAAELDYRPNPAARSLRVGKTRTVGFVSDAVTVTRYASAMIRGVLDTAEQQNHTVLIAETGSSAARMREALDVMLDRRPDGLVFALMAARRVEVPDVPSDVAVVMLNATANPPRPHVLPAEYDAGYQITRLLLDAGHRRIGLIGSSPEEYFDPEESATVGDRFAGIDAALAEAGVELAIDVPQRGWEPEGGFRSMTTILESGVGVTGLICLNDRIAFGAYQAIGEAGLKIPDDISVVSFDDDEIARYLRPGLTTARIPYEEMGRLAMALVLSGATGTDRHLVPMTIMDRDSVRTLETSESASSRDLQHEDLAVARAQAVQHHR